MILYVDTSALVKLYVEESGTLGVVARVEHAEAVATALITYAEARAALARHRREGWITATDLRRAVRELDRDWRTYNIVDLSDSLVHSAGALAERHALRGYDAVQLAGSPRMIRSSLKRSIVRSPAGRFTTGCGHRK